MIDSIIQFSHEKQASWTEVSKLGFYKTLELMFCHVPDLEHYKFLTKG